jgi:hypothetical protein
MDATASKIRIAQRACIEMGVKVLSSFNDGSSPANVIRVIYDDCRQEFLEEHPWSFCTRTVVLATLSTVPVDFGDGALIAYAPPADFLSLYKVNYGSAIIRQENINNDLVIVSDTAGLVVKYCIDNDNPATYSAKARLALAHKIASAGYFKLVEGGAKGKELFAMYEHALMTAIADDSKGSTPDQMNADNIFFERMGGAGAAVGARGNNNNIGFFPTGNF